MPEGKAFFSPRSVGLLAPLQSFFDDGAVSEIVLNRPGEIFVEKHGEFSCHAVPEYTPQTLAMLFQLIANEGQQNLSVKTPLLSGNLFDGSRIQLVVPPVSQQPTFSIRRKIVQDFTLEHYAHQNFYQETKSFDLAAPDFSQLPESEQQLIQHYQQQQWDSFIRGAIQLKKKHCYFRWDV